MENEADRASDLARKALKLIHPVYPFPETKVKRQFVGCSRKMFSRNRIGKGFGCRKATLFRDRNTLIHGFDGKGNA